MRCPVCNRLSIRPCRASKRGIAWTLAHQLFERLVHVPDGSVQYSKAAGKFVVSMFSGQR